MSVTYLAMRREDPRPYVIMGRHHDGDRAYLHEELVLKILDTIEDGLVRNRFRTALLKEVLSLTHGPVEGPQIALKMGTSWPTWKGAFEDEWGKKSNNKSSNPKGSK